jgi:tRNA-specific 2-thiouridylase
VLGRHEGILHYTVGQRRGLGVAAGDPLFVLRLDRARRQVIVGPRSALEVHRIRIADVNWLGEASPDPKIGLPVFVRVRSTRPPRPATLFANDGGAEVELDGGEEGIAPGQACVIYESADDRARVLGGGVIRGAVAAHERQGANASRLATANG